MGSSIQYLLFDKIISCVNYSYFLETCSEVFLGKLGDDGNDGNSHAKEKSDAVTFLN